MGRRDRGWITRHGEKITDEDDWEGWKLLANEIVQKVQLVDDDLCVTSLDRLSRGMAERSSNSILIIKPNQVGISETVDAIKMAKKLAGQLPPLRRDRGYDHC